MRVLPPHATDSASTSPEDSPAGPFGDSIATGLRCRCGWSPPKLASDVVPGCSRCVVHRHSSAQPLPPKCTSSASSWSSTNGAIES